MLVTGGLTIKTNISSIPSHIAITRNVHLQSVFFAIWLAEAQILNSAYTHLINEANDDGEGGKLLPVETDEEWDMIEEIVNTEMDDI